MISKGSDERTLAKIQAQLAEEYALVERRRLAQQNALKETEVELNRIGAAMHALDGSGGPRRASAARRPGTFDVDEITQLVQAMLRPDATMELGELRAGVESEAHSASRSLIGLRVRLMKALRDERFVMTESAGQKLIRLRDAGTVPVK